MFRHFLYGLAVLSIFTTGQPELAQAESPPAIVPLVDYHQHLLSPAVAELNNRLLFKVTPLPAALKQVLDMIEAHWNDAKALAPLYTANSAANSRENDWKRGREAVAEYVGKQFRAAYRFIPINVDVTPVDAHISGNLARDEGAGLRTIGVFVLVLAKEPDGRWRISTEFTTFPG